MTDLKSKACYRINSAEIKIYPRREFFAGYLLIFIRHVMVHADIVWLKCAKYKANELETIQREAARIVTGITKLVSNGAFHS